MIYEAIGDTLEEALEKAHMQIPLRPGTDYTTSRVVEWGMQYGGFVGKKIIYVKVMADDGGAFKTDG
jgi:hypothetical protein